MFFIDLLVAVGVALLLTAIFAVAFGAGRPWPSIWIVFLLVLLGAWAAGLWARPAGPVLWGVYWLPFLVFGLIVVLILAAASPPEGRVRSVPPRTPAPPEAEGPQGAASTPATPRDAAPDDAEAASASVAIGTIFWVVLVVLAVAVLLGYLW